jgi:hypothetical protein
MRRILSHPRRALQQLHTTLRTHLLTTKSTLNYTYLTRTLVSTAAPARTLLSTVHTPRPTTRTMSSDAAYASFLDKANQDTGATQQQSSGSAKKSYGTKSVDTAVPKALEQVEEYYVSDADEPFEPVALAFSGKDISASTYSPSHVTLTMANGAAQVS